VKSFRVNLDELHANQFPYRKKILIRFELSG